MLSERNDGNTLQTISSDRPVVFATVYPVGTLILRAVLLALRQSKSCADVSRKSRFLG